MKRLTVNAIKSLLEEFQNYFNEFQTLQTELEIFAAPVNFEVTKAPVTLQMELFDIRNDLSLKAKYCIMASLLWNLYVS